MHSPMQGADKYMRKFAHIEDIQRRIFAAMLANLDDSVGEVIGKLREKELERDTLIVFLSDNGGPTRELTSSNLPLRDGKGSVYEGGLRIPFIVQWKGKLPAGKIYRNPVISLDLFATAAALSGASLDKKRIYDGVNLIPYLSGKNTGRPHETLYWRSGNRTALRVGDWKLLRNPKRKQPPTWELYNLAADLREMNNLAETNPDRLKQLQTAWEKLDNEMIEPVWHPRR